MVINGKLTQTRGHGCRGSFKLTPKSPKRKSPSPDRQFWRNEQTLWEIRSNETRDSGFQSYAASTVSSLNEPPEAYDILQTD